MSLSPHDNIRPLHEPNAPDHFAIPAEQLERVIARASILQHAEGDGAQRQLSEAEIIGIGKEVGLEPEYVRRALAEYRAEALAPPAPDDHPWMERLFGAAHTRVRRVMRGNPQDIHRAFESRLRGDESMRAIRLRGTASVWEPDSSWMSKITRALDLEGRGFELTQLKSLSIVTAPASPNESLVTLTADLSETRSEHLQGWSFGLFSVFFLALMLGVGSWAGNANTWVWLLVPLLTAVTAVIATFMIQRSMESRRRRAALLLEGLLDQLEFSRR